METDSSEKDEQIIVIPPKRDTTPLDLGADEKVKDVARRQLESLNSKERKNKKKSTSDTESNDPKQETAQKDHSSNAAGASTIEFGIEIPHEIMLSDLSTEQTKETIQTQAPQLDGQELIDILEGKADDHEAEVFEVVMENTDSKTEQASFELVTEEIKIEEAKQKILEREIAMHQIASLPVRKNKKANKPFAPRTPIAASLAAEWEDDKNDEISSTTLTFEVQDVEIKKEEPKIKILNVSIINEREGISPKPAPAKAKKSLPGQLPTKSEPKILNVNAPSNLSPPKILNVNAPSGEGAPATFKRSRVIKKKVIWDPDAPETQKSYASLVSAEKKHVEKLPLHLPPSITIKKLTKDSITKAARSLTSVEPNKTEQKTPTPATTGTKKAKKKSEIDKLLGDEGAVNMIYSLERENNNEDVPEIDERSESSESADGSKDKSILVTKAKAIKNVVLKQSSSPPDAKPSVRPSRIKREATPVKTDTVETEKINPAVKLPKIAASRKRKSDNSWDFLYSQAQATCDDAMIIRRRSNSSYSSSAASPRRLSLDQSGTNDSIESPPASASKLKKEPFEFTKPPEKSSKTPADEVLPANFVSELRGKISTVLQSKKEKAEKAKPAQEEKASLVTPARGRKRAAAAPIQESQTPSKRASERRSNGSDHKEYQLVKGDQVAHITLNQNPLSISLLSEMKTILNQLESDDTCQVVLITSSVELSQGLDYSTLVQTKADDRKQAASDLVTAVKNFLISLAAFPKLLVCGVKGSISGLAVTMLPLFDLVFADKAATFSLPHARIGSNPEGISILQFSGKVRTNAINEMFYLSDTLDVNAAHKYGLVSKIISDNFNKELLSNCKRLSSYSSQALESTKSLLNEEFLSSIDSHLSKETKILQQQWISAECQDKFKKHSVRGECPPIKMEPEDA